MFEDVSDVRLQRGLRSNPGKSSYRGTASVPFPYDARNVENPSYRGPLVEPQKHGNFSNYGAAKTKSYHLWRPYFWTAEPIDRTRVTPRTKALKSLRVAKPQPRNAPSGKPSFVSRLFARKSEASLRPAATQPSKSVVTASRKKTRQKRTVAQAVAPAP